MKHKAKGFTLVEILVVIAIIATLAGIATPIIIRSLNNSRIVETRNIIRSLTEAADAYYEDNSYIHRGTITGFSNSNEDFRAWTSDNKDMALSASGADADASIIGYLRELLGEDSSGAIVSKTYTAIPNVVSFTTGAFRNGSTLRSIVDAWGSGYLIYIDSDQNNTIDIEGSSMPDGTDFDGQLINNAGLLNVISPGPDGMLGGGDDVASWN